MKVVYRSVLLSLAALVLLFQTAALAAALPVVSGVRFGANDTRDRIVLDLTQLPAYQVTTENKGQRILIDLGNAVNQAGIPAIQSEMVQQVSFTTVNGHLRMVIDLNAAANYQVRTFTNPVRLAIDVSKEYETVTRDQPAKGLTHTLYVRKDGRGMLTAHILEADKNFYTIKPALANGKIAGRQTVSGISDDNNAAAAENSSYFALNGELIGITKIDGSVVGTIYYKRSAIGIMPDGSAVFGQGTYNGSVTIHGVTLPVSGVDCERGENNLTIYNKYYDATTKTNEFGMEYVVRGGRVTAINTANSAIPADGMVISVHGTAKDAFSAVKVGDKVLVQQDLGTPWNDAVQIIGAGPTLVKNGQVYVTAEQEEFPSDITSGRAPRTAAGVTKDGNFLLVVVDGRQESSIGCTLKEMAELLKKFGATDAINFDGGGSSEMVIGGQVMNQPSDGSERRVGAALIVVKK